MVQHPPCFSKETNEFIKMGWKKVKHTRRPPHDNIIAVGILERTRPGHYEIKMDNGGYAATFNGVSIEHNGKKITVRY